MRTPRRTPSAAFPRRPARSLRWLAALLALAGCGREDLLHGLDEPQANEAIVALDEGGIGAEKRREDGAEERWAVTVATGDAARAHRVLAERELPRAHPAGFGEVFGKGSIVPSPTEERALYLHALAGELARTVQAVDGVVAARVHLALPAPDPLRASVAPPPRAAVLVKARPGARGRIEPLAPGLQQLVAGAVTGLDPAAVAVVVTEGAAAAPQERRAVPPARAILLALSGVGALAAAAIGAWPRRGALLALGRRTGRSSP